LRGQARIVGSLLFVGFAVLAVQSQPTPSDDEIRRLLVQQSLAAYDGSCPCPESRNGSGNRCGGNSAYSRPGGQQPLCYPSDVTVEMISAYRKKPITP
jgi:hypothetical protein